MKKLFAIIMLIATLAITGCTNKLTVNYKGVSFNYPSNLTISYNSFDPFHGENIDVETSYIADFMSDCVETRREFQPDLMPNELYQEYETLLKHLRDFGLNDDIASLESINCGYAGGNLSEKFININGINGVIYNKALGQSGLPELNIFFKQVLLVGPENQVYSIVFNYDFGELNKVLNKYRDEFGTPMLEESEDDRWMEVRDHFAYGNSITDFELKLFEDNEKVIDEIISTIKIAK